ncbi:MAG: hypothetical protein IH940_11170 [Acidobacteria bacterium]|nr:hypothetical protein [Acidobacteriota bacterium]
MDRHIELPTPAVFDWLVEACALDLDNAHKVFNMGIGMVAIVAPGNVEAFVAAVDEPTYVIGEVTDRPGVALQ